MEGRAVVLGILVVLISSVFVLGVCTNLGADKVGTIIIFKTYYLPDEVSLDLINIVDDEFLKVFNSLGPFDVEVIDLRLNKDNVEEIFKILSNAKKGKKIRGKLPCGW